MAMHVSVVAINDAEIEPVSWSGSCSSIEGLRDELRGSCDLARVDSIEFKDEAFGEWQSVEDELRHEASAYEQSIAANFDSNCRYADEEIGGGLPRVGAGARRSTRSRKTRKTH